jgi:hypothetical protein
MAKSLEKPSMDLTDAKDLDIEKLNIICYTNKNTKNGLTANMFVFENNQTIKGDYPFLCTNVEYNKEYLENKQLFEKVQIFFNRYEFEQFLLSSKKKSNNKNLVRENIFYMLTVMFPISFPIKDTVTSYYENNYVFNWTRAFKAVRQEYEYVNLNIEKPSTVTQVVWLDTLSKNPIYIDLYETIKSYKRKVIDYMTQKSKGTELNSKNTETTFKFVYLNFAKNLQDLIKDRPRSRGVDLNSFFDSLTKFQKLVNAATQDNDILKTEAMALVNSLRELFATNQNQIDSNFIEELDATESLINAKGNEERDKPAIRAILEQYKTGVLTDTEMKAKFSDYASSSHGSTWWKLYFIFARLKKNTLEYNSFVQRYVKTKIVDSGSRESRYYYYNSESANESKFNKNLADLDFHFDFMKEMEPFILQRRRSMNPQISNLFRDEEDRYVVEMDKFLGMFNNKDQRNADAGVDIVKQSSSTKQNQLGEEDSNASAGKEKTAFYEIQLGVALVGGIVGGKAMSTNREFCKFQAIKLAKDYKFLTKYGYDNTDKIYLYPYVELDENAEQPKELPTILNLKKKGGRRKTRQYKRGNRTRKLFYRNSQEKKPKNN